MPDKSMEAIMNKLDPWTFGAVLSITVVANYVLCAIFWYSFTGLALDFLNSLFHGMDFRKIYIATPFSISWSLYVLAVLAAWAYVLGAIYAGVRNLLLGNSAR
jgi:hypothetical protein